MSTPRGSVYLTEEAYEIAITTPTGQKQSVPKRRHAWRGLIHGDGRELWGGRCKQSRSEAYADMAAANVDLDIGANLVSPLPDDHPV